jgi:hypothetical protein
MIQGGDFIKGDGENFAAPSSGWCEVQGIMARAVEKAAAL